MGIAWDPSELESQEYQFSVRKRSRFLPTFVLLETRKTKTVCRPYSCSLVIITKLIISTAVAPTPGLGASIIVAWGRLWTPIGSRLVLNDVNMAPRGPSTRA